MLSPDTVMMRMFLDGYRLITDRGYDWLYNFPAPGWTRLLSSVHHFGLKPWKVQAFPCMEVVDDRSPDAEYELKVIGHFPEGIREIWKHFREDHKEMSFFTRDIEWLNYKWGDDLKIGIFGHSGVLEGYAVIRKKTGLLLDFILNDTDDFTGVFIQLKKLFGSIQQKEQKDSLQTLKFMPTSFLQSHFQDLKTNPVDFQFVFGLSSLAGEHALQSVDLDKWHVFPND